MVIQTEIAHSLTQISVMDGKTTMYQATMMLVKISLKIDSSLKDEMTL